MKRKKKAHRKARSHKKTFVTNPARRTRRRRAHHKANPSRKRARRHYRHNPADSMAQLVTSMAVGAVAAIAANKLASKLPIANNLIKNVGMIALGGALAFFGYKKKNSMLIGAGSGVFIAGATRAVTNAVPALAGDYELTGDEQQGYVEAVSGALAGSLSGALAGDEFAGDEFAGEYQDQFSGALGSPSI